MNKPERKCCQCGVNIDHVHKNALVCSDLCRRNKAKEYNRNYIRNRYKNDTVFRENVKKRERDRRKDPEISNYQKRYHRQKYQDRMNDPLFAQRERERNRIRFREYLSTGDNRSRKNKRDRERRRYRYKTEPSYRRRVLDMVSKRGQSYRKPHNVINIIIRDGLFCSWCFTVLPPAFIEMDGIVKINPSIDIDHIQPLSKGGSHDIDNLQLMHHVCNLKKWAN